MHRSFSRASGYRIWYWTHRAMGACFVLGAVHFALTRVAANGHAVTLLWAEIPKDDDDGGLAELDTPGFR